MDIVASTVIIVINIKGVEAIDSCCRLARLSLQNSCLIAHSEPIWNASVAISNLWLEMQNAECSETTRQPDRGGMHKKMLHKYFRGASVSQNSACSLPRLIEASEKDDTRVQHI